MISDLNGQEQIFRIQTGRYEVIFTRLNRCVFNEKVTHNGIHCHDCFEICFVKEGSGVFCIENKKFLLERDCIFLGFPFVPHEIMLGESTYLKVGFMAFNIVRHEGKFMESTENIIIENFLLNQNILSYRQSHIGEYAGMLDRYLYQGGEYAEKNMVFTMLLDMLLSLSQSRVQPENDNIYLKQRIDRYIYNHMDKKIMVSDLCGSVNISERALYYFFKSQIHTTPNNYILNMKISASVGLLRMKLPIKNIAHQFGFLDASAYCRCFKKIKGTSPQNFIFKCQKERNIE